MEGIYRLSAVMSAEGTNKPERPPFNPGAAFQSIAARGDPPPGMTDAGDRSALHLGNGSGEGDIFLYVSSPAASWPITTSAWEAASLRAAAHAGRRSR